MTKDPRFEYLTELRELKVDQVRRSSLGLAYKIVAIERSGYCITQQIGGYATVHEHILSISRIWCDVLEAWPVIS